MDPNLVILLLGLSFLFGAALRVFGRAAIEWGNNPDFKWNWRMVVGQAVSTVVGLLPAAVTAEQIKDFVLYADNGWIGYVMAIIAGYGVAALGRAGQKATDFVRGKRDGP